MRHAIAILVFLALITSISFATNLNGCGVINSPGSYQLTANGIGAPNVFYNLDLFGGNEHACIVITAPNVVFDCNGHSITGVPPYYHVGIYVSDSASGVTIRNCPQISGYCQDIEVYHSSNNIISNVSLSNTKSCYGYGLQMYRGSNNVVANSTMFGNGDGIELYDTGFGNTLTGNTVNDSMSAGIVVAYGQNGSIITNNNVTNSNFGFDMEDGGGFYVANNSAVNNQQYGFYISNNNIPGGDHLSINNTAYNNSAAGFFIYGSRNNTFVNDTSQDNGWDKSVGYSYDVYLANYVSEADCNNRIDGMNGSGGRPILYYNTTVGLSNTEASEIILCNADGSTLNNVTVHGSDSARNDGIIMRDTDNAVMANNLERNISFGFEIDNSKNNLFANNTFLSVSYAGYELYDASDNNVFLNNSVDNNSFWAGFSFGNSMNESLINNTASNCQYGFYMAYGSDYSMSGNRAYNDLVGSVVDTVTSESLTNEHYYNNTNDMVIGGPYSGATSFNATGIILDNPAGNYQNFTNLSITDSLSNAEYTISWSGQPATPPSSNNPFAQKYIDISPVFGSISIDNITWRWNGTEVSDGGYNESRFTILKYGGGIWTRLSPTLSTSAHTLTLLSFVPASVYGIMEMNGTDTTPPVVSLNSPGEGDTLTNSTVAFNFTATDETSATMACVLYIDGTANQTNPSVLNNTPTVFQVSGIRNGYYNWYVRCSDDAANTGTSETRNFTMDYPTGCVVINSPDATVMSLDGEGAPNAVLGGNACVVISSSDVLFDCNGHSILNDRTPTAYGIVLDDSVSNVTVRNCPGVSGYDYGVYSYQSSGSVLSNITAQSNGQYGFYDFSGTGNRFTNDTAYNNTRYGFYLDGSSGDNLSGDNSYGNPGDISYQGTGFYLNSANGNVLAGNTADNNPSYGFYLSASSGNNLTGDVAFNASNGFSLQSGTGNTLRNNSVSGSGTGFSLYSETSDALSGNRAYNNYAGTWMGDSDLMSLVDEYYSNTGSGLDILEDNGNTVSFNASGIVIDSPAGGYRNYTNLSISDTLSSEEYTIRWSTNYSALPENRTSFAQKFVDISPVFGTPSIDSINWTWQNAELQPADNESTFGVWRFDVDWEDRNATLDTGANTLTLANEVPGSIYGILENVTNATENCPVITEPGTYVQTADYTGAPNDVGVPYAGFVACVLLNTSNAVFDCDGHNITGDGTPFASGIWVNGSYTNVTIKNCVVSNYSLYGIETLNSADSVIANNMLYDDQEGFLNGAGSSGLIIANNTAYNDSADGFDVSGGPHSVINNTARDNGYGFGVSFSNGTVLANNTAYNSEYAALYIDSVDGAVIANDHYYNSSPEILVGSTPGVPYAYSLSGVIIDNPAGGFASYTNISLNDTVASPESYAIRWVTNSTPLPAGKRAFAQKFINITNLSSAVSIDGIAWSWQDSELYGYVEGSFELWKYNSGGWAMQNGTLDTENNTLALHNLNPESTYGILQYDCRIPTDHFLVNTSTIFCPGTYYVNDSGASGVVIANADSISIACDNATIIGNGAGNGFYVSGRSNVTVSGCMIVNYSNGINLDSPYYEVVDNNTVINSTGAGIYFAAGTSGLFGYTIIDNNSISGSPASTGIYLAQGSVCGNFNNNYNHVSNNVIGNTSNGIFILGDCGGSASNNMMANNTCINASTCYYLYNSNGNVNSNTFANNTCLNASSACYHLYTTNFPNMNSNSFTNNIAGNTPYGIYLDHTWGGTMSGNTFTGNTIFNAGVGVHLYAPGGDNMYGNTFSYNNISNASYAVFFNGTPSQTYRNDFGGTNTLDGLPFYHYYGWSNSVTSGLNLNATQNRSMNATNLGLVDLIDCNNLTIANSNLSGDPDYQVFVYNAAGGGYNNIINNTMAGGPYGIYLNSPYYERVINNTITSATSAGIFSGAGTYTSTFGYMTIDRNTISGSPASTAIYLDFGTACAGWSNSYNNVSNNVVGNSSNGVLLVGACGGSASNNQILNNTCLNASTCYYMYGSDGHVDSNTFANDICLNASSTCYHLYTANFPTMNSNSFINDTAGNTPRGVYLDQTWGGTMNGNTFVNDYLNASSYPLYLESSGPAGTAFYNTTFENDIASNFINNPGTAIAYTNTTFIRNQGRINFQQAISLSKSVNSANTALGTDIASIDSSALTELAIPANVTTYAPQCPATIFWKAGFPTTSAEIISGGSQCVGPQCANKACAGNLVTFSVLSFSGYTANTSEISPPPNVTLESPAAGYNASKRAITFNCSANASGDLSNITLYGNFTGSWQANTTNTVSGTSNSTTFSLNLSYARYSWNCLAYDTDGNFAWAPANYTFTADSLPLDSNFGGSTTDFSSALDLTNVSTPILENPAYGKLQWNNTGLNVAGADFNSYILFGTGWVSVDSSHLSPTLNSPANITLYGLPNEYMPILYSDGAVCSDCSILAYLGHNLSFTVQHFTNYSAGPNSNLTIYDQYEGSNVSKLTPITFYANYTNATDNSHVAGATCVISFDDATSGTMVDTGTQYNYTKASGFSTTGIHLWNVTCNTSGYETLFAQDDVDVGPLNLTGNMTSLYQANVTNATTLPRFEYNASGNLSTEGGNISGVDVGTEQLTDRWAAFYGNISGSIMLTDKAGANNVYQWGWTPASGGVVCTSTNSSATDLTLYPADGDDIDAAWSFAPTEPDSGRNTFNQTGCDLTIGTTPITNAGYADTGQAGGFITCSLKDTTIAAKQDMYFCTNITQNGVFWNNQVGDFELMVPTAFGNNVYETYYFYVNLD